MNQAIFRKGVILIVTAALAGSVGWYAHAWHGEHYFAGGQRRVSLKGYQFTSPLLDVELPEGLKVNREPQPFKYKIKAYVQQKLRNRQLNNIAVYYRDLQDGPWFAINKDIEFNPASMMKVPVMIAWLKRAEKDPAVLHRRLLFDSSKNPVPEEYTKPARTLVSGRQYTIDELLHYMMNYSDNKATSLLYHALSDKEMGDVLDDMDINNNPAEGENSLNIHGYSGFFRILYNAAYLNREMSEKALQLLSLQDFKLGIASGVPEEVKVASKFGEVVPESGQREIQLHDFGIVYHPKGPYILGVMTRGYDYAAQAEVIRDISRMVYTEVDSSVQD